MPDASIVSSTPRAYDDKRTYKNGQSLIPNYTAISRRSKTGKGTCGTLSERGYVCTLVKNHPVWCPHLAGGNAGIVEVWYTAGDMAKMDKQTGGDRS